VTRRLSTDCGATTENRGNKEKKPSKTDLFGYLTKYVQFLFISYVTAAI
jgi:hypothetical protein